LELISKQANDNKMMNSRKIWFTRFWPNWLPSMMKWLAVRMMGKQWM